MLGAANLNGSNDVAGAFDAAGSTAELRDAIVEVARTLLPISGVSFVPYERGVPFGTNGAFSHDEFSSTVMREQALAMFPLTEQEIGTPAALFAGRKRTIDLNILLGPRGLERTQVYNEFWRPFRIERQLVALLGSPIDPLGFVAVSRTSAEPAFAPAELALVECLRSQLLRPLERLIRDDARPASDLAGLLAAGLPIAAALFDAAGQLLWVSELARQELGVSEPESQSTMSATPALSEWRAVGLRAIARKAPISESSELLAQRVEASTGTPAAIVMRQKDHTRPHDRVRTASREFALTRRESELLGHLSEGRSNKEIANDLDCSVRTVETHVSSILRKASCTSRTELLARLCS